MNCKALFEGWRDNPYFDDNTRGELSKLTDESEIADRFYRNLEFGTGGLRGLMGAGTNRINKYTVRRATYGLAKYLLASELDNVCARGVVIAYDTRLNSAEYAMETALVLCACGLRAYLFDAEMPTPVLSFAVHYLNCVAGVVITASHNPKEYNGYKVYNEKGVQFVPEHANAVTEKIDEVKGFDEIPLIHQSEAIEKKLLYMLDISTFDAFLDEVLKQSLMADAEAKRVVKIVYTPLNGAGNIPVRKALKLAGFTDVAVVTEQESPDGSFPTLRSPNPEEKDALTLAVAMAEKNNADLVLGTDPDCDRLGAAVLHGGEYTLLTGNQIGALLVSYILSNKSKNGELNSKSTLIKTIVTNDLGAEIAKSYGLQVVETLTGFKYIGEQMALFDETKKNEFIFGYEESYGYLTGSYARDKDAVTAAMLLCELVAECKKVGKTLIDTLGELYNKFGYYLDALDSFTMSGEQGRAQIEAIMHRLRGENKSFFADCDELKDYNEGLNGLSSSNVLKFIFRDGSWLAVRPSGTEPKIKFYYSVRASEAQAAQARLDVLREIVQEVALT